MPSPNKIAVHWSVVTHHGNMAEWSDYRLAGKESPGEANADRGMYTSP